MCWTSTDLKNTDRFCKGATENSRNKQWAARRACSVSLREDWAVAWWVNIFPRKRHIRIWCVTQSCAEVWSQEGLRCRAVQCHQHSGGLSPLQQAWFDPHPPLPVAPCQWECLTLEQSGKGAGSICLFGLPGSFAAALTQATGLSSGVTGWNTVTCNMQEVSLGDLTAPFGLRLYEYSCKTNCLNPLPKRCGDTYLLS